MKPKEKAAVVPIGDSKLLLDRLKRLVDASGGNATALSKKAGLGPTYINDVLVKKNSSPSIPATQAIARVLNTTVAYLLGETDYPSVEFGPRAAAPIPRLGIVETGAFRKLPDGVSFPMAHRPLSKLYPAAKHFTLLVGDDAMGAAVKEGPILAGMEVLCIDMADAGLIVESGRIYAIRRSQDGGQTYETIIRRAMVFRNRTELLAESNWAAHEKIVHKGHLSTTPDREIFALGLVYGVVRIFE